MFQDVGALPYGHVFLKLVLSSPIHIQPSASPQLAWLSNKLHSGFSSAELKSLTQEEKLTIRGGYNLPSLSFTAEELYRKIKEEIPEFECEFEPDNRQDYADSWPDEIDGTLSENDWGFKLEYDLDLMCREMINSLKNS